MHLRPKTFILHQSPFSPNQWLNVVERDKKKKIATSFGLMLHSRACQIYFATSNWCLQLNANVNPLLRTSIKKYFHQTLAGKQHLPISKGENNFWNDLILKDISSKASFSPKGRGGYKIEWKRSSKVSPSRRTTLTIPRSAWP